MWGTETTETECLSSTSSPSTQRSSFDVGISEYPTIMADSTTIFFFFCQRLNPGQLLYYLSHALGIVVCNRVSLTAWPGLELVILPPLPLPASSWDYSCVPHQLKPTNVHWDAACLWGPVETSEGSLVLRQPLRLLCPRGSEVWSLLPEPHSAKWQSWGSVLRLSD
jgi:hypothetical protein